MSESRKDSNLLELSSAFTLEKRFERDFEVIEKIGEGGFATVFKAKNLLDDIEYAVKKIVLNMKNKTSVRVKKRNRHSIKRN